MLLALYLPTSIILLVDYLILFFNGFKVLLLIGFGEFFQTLVQFAAHKRALFRAVCLELSEFIKVILSLFILVGKLQGKLFHVHLIVFFLLDFLGLPLGLLHVQHLMEFLTLLYLGLFGLLELELFLLLLLLLLSTQYFPVLHDLLFFRHPSLLEHLVALLDVFL